MNENRTVPGAPLPVSASIAGIAGDAMLLYVLLKSGISAGTAGMVSLLVVATPLIFFYRQADPRGQALERFAEAGRFTVAVILIIFLRAGVLAWMGPAPGAPILVPAIVAAIVAGILLRAAMAVESDVQTGPTIQPLSWRSPVVALLIYAVLLRLVYLGLPELIHEEAYYWNYSRHLALGYLDHPPMVGWTIRCFTALLGHSELGVRAGAFFWWLVGAGFVFKLTRRIYNNATAICAAILFAVLPAYFLFGLVITPEAPLFACWAGALYFLYRALIDEIPSAWVGAGIFFGLGLLSKYTIVLLGCSAMVFMLADARSRKWFRRAPPYMALGIALLLFSPVLIWNFQNDWISFAFQSSQRLAASFDFNLPALLGYCAALLTPVGFAAVVVAFISRSELCPERDRIRREHFFHGFRLLSLSTLLPLSVFVFFSLIRLTKINWTGPLWIGALPFLARMMVVPLLAETGRWRAWLSPRTWRTTIVVLLLMYGGGLQYLTVGLLGLSYPQNDTGMVALGWHDLAARIEAAVQQVEKETGRKPLVIGMEGDRLSSWLAYYRSRAKARTDPGIPAAALDTAGPDRFGQESHMYRLWFPASQQDIDRPLMLVGENPNQLDVSSTRQWAGPMREVSAAKNGQITWHLYYRTLL